MNKIGGGVDGKINALSSCKKLFLIILIIFLLIISFFKVTVLHAHNYKNNEYIKMWKISKGEEFFVEHTHSVQQTTVSEKYRIIDNDIYLLESKFKSLGAGLPATTPYKFELIDGGFRIYDINQKMDDLVYKAGAVRANHRIIIKGKIYYFLDFTQPRTGVKFEVKKVPVLEYFLKEGFK